MTADDVVASFRHHMGKDSKSAAKSLLDAVADIKADGDETVIFTLNGGNADFPYIASDYHIPIMPAKDDGTVDWQSGIRTGPFMPRQVRAGRSRNAQAQSQLLQDDKPYFDEVECLAHHRCRGAHQRPELRRGALHRIAAISRRSTC